MLNSLRIAALVTVALYMTLYFYTWHLHRQPHARPIIQELRIVSLIIITICATLNTIIVFQSPNLVSIINAVLAIVFVIDTVYSLLKKEDN